MSADPRKQLMEAVQSIERCENTIVQEIKRCPEENAELQEALGNLRIQLLKILYPFNMQRAKYGLERRADPEVSGMTRRRFPRREKPRDGGADRRISAGRRSSDIYGIGMDRQSRPMFG